MNADELREFNADSLSMPELVKIMYRDLKEMNHEFKEFRKRMETDPPENKMMREELNQLKLDLALERQARQSDIKVERESKIVEAANNRRWTTALVVGLNLIIFFIQYVLKDVIDK